MRPTDEEITRHHDSRRDADSRVPGRVGQPLSVGVEDWDPAWAGSYDGVVARVRAALGAGVLAVHHVGSTSVPGLPAKPVIDVDLVVADPTGEASYVPALEAAGFTHWLREPWWHEHRLLKLADPLAHLHVFGPDCPEVIRHLMFREWLVAHPDEQEVYAEAKRRAAAATRAGGGTGMDYNRVKEPVVLAIYERMFRAAGMLPDELSTAD